jgi:hypothetical protein
MKEYKVKIEGLKEKWFENNQLVKEIGYYSNGQKHYEFYYLNDKLHRENGPARQYWYENGKKCYEDYHLDNKYHREDGPACQYWYENGKKCYEDYYLNGKKVSKEEVMNTSKTINIKGKEVSEETILNALKNYFK